MKKKAVIFDIENIQDEYVYCLHIIDLIEKKQNYDFIPDFRNKVRVVSYETSTSIEDQIKDILECVSEPLPENVTEMEVNTSFIYFFHVNCTNESDLINLIYYCLLHDKLSQDGHECILCVECSMKQSFNISDFLTWVLYTGTVENCYIHADKKYWPIEKNRLTNLRRELDSRNIRPRNRIRIMKQFSPIFRIDKDADEKSCESITYWRQPMRTFLEKLYKEMKEKQEKLPVLRDDKDEKAFGDNYFLPHVRPTNFCTYIEEKKAKPKSVTIMEKCGKGNAVPTKSIW